MTQDSSSNERRNEVIGNTIGISILLFLVVALIYQAYKYINIVNNRAYTVGKIISIERQRRAGYTCRYRYSVTSKTYEARQDCSIRKECHDRIMSRRYKIIYSSSDPENSALLLTPEDFARYQLQYPQSLKWLREECLSRY